MKLGECYFPILDDGYPSHRCSEHETDVALCSLATADLEREASALRARVAELERRLLDYARLLIWSHGTTTFCVSGKSATPSPSGEKVTMGDLSPHFDKSEFKCGCNGKYCNGYPVNIHGKLIEVLEAMRGRLRRPIVITSGLRCPKWNAEVGGKSGSEHMQGEAADIAAVSSNQRWEVVGAAYAVGCRRIGVGKTFVHIGVDGPPAAQGVLWLYN